VDFYRIVTSEPDKKGVVSVFPDYTPNGFSDLMIRGGSFYAIWDEEKNTWSTDEYDVPRLVDQDIYRAVEEFPAPEVGRYSVKWMNSFSSASWIKFKSFVNSVSDRYHPLDRKLVFLDDKTTKTDYVTKSLPYKLEKGSHDAWDELISTLYSPIERQKIEWAIGSVVSGESRFIQKFLVFYGSSGTGKSTILNIVEKLFEGYFSAFEAKSLGSNNGAFATAAFKHNPLVAIQHDGDLSRIEDNTKLNSIVAHEDILINEKFQTAYTMKIDSFLFMGTNKPVKITDSRSGLVRRVIDVHPTGVTIPYERYLQLMNQTNFELGSIAQHCLDVYNSLGKSYYNAYQPVEMMAQTDYFYNFVASAYDIFEEQGGISTAQAWSMFKEFLEEQKVDAKMPQYKFRDELKNYFHTFEQRIKIDGHWVWGWYSGFDTKRFIQHDAIDSKREVIDLDSTSSILDEVLEVMPAQYGRKDSHGDEVPEKRWDWVKTTLRDLDTQKLHYVKVPQNHIVIDFDLTDEDGEKSLELNLDAASKWPSTYAETSKSGKGVHLHYLYDGDTELLRSIYSEGIEVKVFKGNSSLRRRLSRCNNVPIATISSGLPLKEKKVLNEDAVLSERQIRNHILSAMRKEIHPGTKSNIDFIHHILTEAYDKGTEYDVSDMKAGIIKFALGSTNQSERALDTVTRMKFASANASEAISESVPQEDPDAKLVFWDVEVYPNLFGIVYKKEGDHDFVTLINPTPVECQQLMRMKLVGFNCRKYDNHILYARSLGYTNEGLYELSQKIISNNPNALFGAAYDLSYTDVYDYASEKMTLKKWEIKLGIKHQEMDIPWDKPVPEDRIDDVMAYCANDVMATEAVHNARKGDYTARLILAELSGLTPNHTTNSHSGAIIFGKNKRPQGAFNYTDLSKEFVGYVFDRGVSTYREEIVGEGGYVYSEPGIYENVALLDVASMHPTSIEQMNLFGDEYTGKFSEMKAARMAIKRQDWETAGTMLDGRLKPFLEDKTQAKMLSDALKIVINSVYGLTSARFDNVFKDPRNKDNVVAKRGALFMIDLKHYVRDELGAQVVHIKTDSIKIPNATPEQIEKINEFGKKYGYDFEHEATYEKFALVNDAVYVARTGGKWSATGAEFQQPYIFKTLFTQDEIEFEDLCVAKSVLKGSMYLKFSPEVKGETFTFVDNKDVRFIGRTGLFCPVKQEAKGAGSLWRVLEDKPYAVAGTKGYFWKEANMTSRDEIDMGYFEDQAAKAVETIEKFGSFEELVK
jgi:hypothetical protein